MGQQAERLVTRYFTEEMIGDEWTGNLYLVTDSRPFGNGIELIVAPNLWTWQEAARFVQFCTDNQIPPAVTFDDSGPVAQR